jgi:hypothetical protein
VPFLVGLLLAPVAALVGTLVLVLFTLGAGAVSRAMIPILLMAGLIEGSVHAAPVTMLALPATYAILRRRVALKVWRLALAGGVAGILAIPLFAAVLAIIGGEIEMGLSKNLAFQDLAAITALSAFSGAVAGACFGYLTRWLRPEPWRGVQTSPSS